MSSMVLFLSRAICDVGPVVEAPRALVIPFCAAGFAASLSLVASVAGLLPNRLLAGAGVVEAAVVVPVVTGAALVEAG